MAHYKDQNITPLGAALQKWIDANRLRSKFQESGLRGEWGRLMGASVDRRTRHLELRQGILSIHLDSDVLCNELQYAREEIRQRLNDVIGTEAIRDVKLFS